jgi:hypothetical protein
MEKMEQTHTVGGTAPLHVSLLQAVKKALRFAESARPIKTFIKLIANLSDGKLISNLKRRL